VSEFGRFFRRTFGPLRNYIARLTGSPDTAQDIAQSAYSKVYTAMNDQPVEHPQALLYRTARNLAIDDIRHRARSPFDRQALEELDPASPAPSTERIVMAREELTLLEHAIRELPEEFRQVVVLRMAESLTHEQVGIRLGLTKKQAEKRLHKAMRMLHAALHSPRGDQREGI
jgi:RNA polymerase sigma factor (sigma-70 family)